MTVQDLDRAFAHKVANKEDISAMLGISNRKYRQIEKQAYRFYKRGSYMKAKVLLEGLIDLNKPRAYPYRILGDIAFKSCLYTEARMLWEKAESMEGEDTWTSLKLGEVFVHTLNIPKAIEYLDRVIASPDKRDDAFKQRAIAIKKSLVAKAAS